MTSHLRSWVALATVAALGCRPPSAPPRLEAGASAPRGEGRDGDIEELKSLARLTARIRHHHPADEAAEAPWDLLLVDAAARLLGAPGRDDRLLGELFAPVAPLLALAPSQAELPPLDLPEAGDRVVAVAHRGVALDRPDANGHLSFRTGRPFWHAPDRGWMKARLFLDGAAFGDAPARVEVRLASPAPEWVGLELRLEPREGPITRQDLHWTQTPGAGVPVTLSVELAAAAHADRVHVVLTTRPLRSIAVLDAAVEVAGGPRRALPTRASGPDTTEGWVLEAHGLTLPQPGAPLVVGRPGELRADLPFTPETRLGDAWTEEIAPGLVARFPLALPADADTTFPPAATDVGAWRARLAQIDAGDRGRPEVRVATVISLWSTLSSFETYPEALHPGWDELLDGALRAVVDGPPEALEPALQSMILALHDGHATLDDDLAPPRGWCALRFDTAEQRVFVTASAHPELQIGDELLESNGEAVGPAMAAAAARTSGTGAWRSAQALNGLRRAATGAAWSGRIRRGGTELPVDLHCPGYTPEPPRYPPQMALDGGVVYVDIRQRGWADGERLQAIRDAKGVIVDLRGYPGALQAVAELYPSGSVGTAAWHHLLDRERPGGPRPGPPSGWVVGGLRAPDAPPVVWLTDGRAVSAAETVLLFARAHQQPIFGPSPTAGADGENVNERLMGTWYYAWTGSHATMLDGAPLFNLGIAPDHPTPLSTGSLSRGEDEPLAAALAWHLARRGGG